MGSLKQILIEISNDNVKSAFKLSKVYLQSKPDNARNILSGVADLIQRTSKLKSLCTSHFTDVYGLVDLCCGLIIENPVKKQTLFMQYLYLIIDYLLRFDADLSKNLSKYYECIYKVNDVKEWTDLECNIIKSTFALFGSHVCNLSNKHDNDLRSWFEVFLKLLTLVKFEKVYKIFTIASSISTSTSKQCNANVIQLLCLDMISNLVNIMKSDIRVSSGFSLNLKEKTELFRFFEIMFELRNGASDANFINTSLNILCHIKSFFPNYSFDIEFLSAILTFFNNLNFKNGSVKDQFDNLTRILLLRKTKEWVIFSILSSLMYKHRTKILEHINVLEVPSLLTVCTELVLMCSGQDNDSRKYTTLANLLAAASYFVYSTSERNLETAYSYIEALFKSVSRLNKCPSQYLPVLLFSFVNTLKVYKKASLYEEVAQLSFHVFNLVLTLDPGLLASNATNKNYIINLLDILAVSHGKLSSSSTEALEALIVFGLVHPQLAPSAFKSFVELKSTLMADGKILKPVLAIDLITDNMSRIEKKWPCFRLMDVDDEVLLLNEIQAYSKAQGLHTETVLKIYSRAARVCKNDFLVSAVLNCTIDSVTASKDALPVIENLELSLNNLRKHLQKKLAEEKANSKEAATLNCMLGNLTYQKLRFNMMRLRRKTEKEVGSFDKLMGTEIPVIRGEVKDELDVATIVPSFQYLSLEQQAPIFELMSESLSFWNSSKEKLVPELSLSCTLRYVKGLGYICRLYKDPSKEATTWKLLYEMANKMDDQKYKLLAVSELLRSVRSVDPELVQSVQSSIDSIEKSNDYVIPLSRINLARNALFNGKMKDCIDILDKVDKNSLNFLVKVEYIIVETMMNISDSAKSTISSSTPLYPLMKIFENLLYLIQQGKWGSFNHLCTLQYLLLDIAHYLGIVFFDLGSIRHSRGFLKNQLKVAQRLALPIRVCELLGILGRIDAIARADDECDTKLIALENILSFTSVNRLELQEWTSRPSSPLLYSSVNVVPHFMRVDSCSCELCCNINYCIQSLNAVVLKGLSLNATKSKMLLAVVMKVGFSIINRLDKLAAVEENNLLECGLVDAIARFYLMVSSYNICWKHYRKAEEFNLKACKLLDNPPAGSLRLLKSHAECAAGNIKWMLNYPKTNRRIIYDNPRYVENLSYEITKTPETQWKTALPSMNRNRGHQGPLTEPTITPIFSRRKLNWELGEEEIVPEAPTPSIVIPEIIVDRRVAATPARKIEGRKFESERKQRGTSVSKPVGNLFCTPAVVKSTRKGKLDSNAKFRIFCDDDAASVSSSKLSTQRKTKRNESNAPTPRVDKKLEKPTMKSGKCLRVEKTHHLLNEPPPETDHDKKIVLDVESDEEFELSRKFSNKSKTRKMIDDTPAKKIQINCANGKDALDQSESTEAFTVGVPVQNGKTSVEEKRKNNARKLFPDESDAASVKKENRAESPLLEVRKTTRVYSGKGATNVTSSSKGSTARVNQRELKGTNSEFNGSSIPVKCSEVILCEDFSSKVLVNENESHPNYLEGDQSIISTGFKKKGTSVHHVGQGKVVNDDSLCYEQSVTVDSLSNAFSKNVVLDEIGSQSNHLNVDESVISTGFKKKGTSVHHVGHRKLFTDESLSSENSAHVDSINNAFTGNLVLSKETNQSNYLDGDESVIVTGFKKKGTSVHHVGQRKLFTDESHSSEKPFGEDTFCYNNPTVAECHKLSQEQPISTSRTYNKHKLTNDGPDRLPRTLVDDSDDSLSESCSIIDGTPPSKTISPAIPKSRQLRSTTKQGPSEENVLSIRRTRQK